MTVAIPYRADMAIIIVVAKWRWSRNFLREEARDESLAEWHELRVCNFISSFKNKTIQDVHEMSSLINSQRTRLK